VCVVVAEDGEGVAEDAEDDSPPEPAVGVEPLTEAVLAVGAVSVPVPVPEEEPVLPPAPSACSGPNSRDARRADVRTVPCGEA
jgi:hypothetical protein